MSTLRCFTYRSTYPVSREAGWQWHANPGAMERLIPPWERITIIRKDEPDFADGARVEFIIRTGPISQRWIAEHQTVKAPEHFSDVQVQGPLKSWIHHHRFHVVDEEHFELEDSMEYQLPGYLENIPLAGPYIAERRLEQLFTYRHHVTANDLACIHRYPNKALRILVSGASGLVGSALSSFLGTAGHEVWKLVRDPVSSQERSIYWDPKKREMDYKACEDFDAVIHLAGENIAGRWTRKKKRRIRDSRVEGTRFLVEQLRQLKSPPRCFLCASAVGYYGDRGSAWVDEGSAQGEGFLAEVCQEWEEASKGLEHSRTVNARLGVVLSPSGGALNQMLLPFKLGIAGKMGSGEQYMPWIALDDVLYQLYHCLMTDGLTGPVNLVSPEAITNKEFTKTLGLVLRRPTLFPMPRLVAKLVMGEMADALIFSSNRVLPSKLQQTHAHFAFPTLEAAFRHQLGRVLN